MKKVILVLTLNLFSQFLPAQLIEVGQGTGVSVFSPICRSRDYSVYEVIYLSSDINATGTINAFAFERADGTEANPIDSVSIYMKHTTLTQLPASNYSDTGYTLVYSGEFPNDSGAGWREVILNTPFAYNGTDHLLVLTVKGYEPQVANTPVTPRWYYTDISPDPDRARRYYGNVAIDATTALTTINYSANARFDFGTVGIREIRGDKMTLYPNPASDRIHVSVATNEQEAMLIVFDPAGRIVFEKKVFPLQGRISETILTEKLSSGMYLIRIEGNDKSYSERVLIE